MNSPSIGKKKTVELRDVWPHEAYDFTTWLKEHHESLSSLLPFNLYNVEREQSAGSFSVDLVGVDDDNNTVVIENQLTKTNHGHLGQLITYLAVRGAKIAVWIVSEARDEHVRAIERLNEGQVADFYLVTVEAITIDDSRPAPIFKLITGPNIDVREIAGAKQAELAGSNIKKKEFWEKLLLGSYSDEPEWHKSVSSRPRPFLCTSSRYPAGVYLGYRVRQHECQAELQIDIDQKGNLTQQMFEKLSELKEDIENEFGEPLEWQPPGNTRYRRVYRLVPIGGYLDEEHWNEIHQELVELINRFDKVFRERVNTIRKNLIVSDENLQVGNVAD